VSVSPVLQNVESKKPGADATVRGLMFGCALVFVGALISGCTVDAELGVAAEVEEASVSASGSGDMVSIGVEMRVRFRVGEHAQGERTFIVPKTDLFVDGRIITTINLDRPIGFDGRLAPGESETVTISGQIVGPLGAEKDAVCAAASGVQLLVRWEDTTAMQIDQVDFLTTSVVCE